MRIPTIGSYVLYCKSVYRVTAVENRPRVGCRVNLIGTNGIRYNKVPISRMETLGKGSLENDSYFILDLDEKQSKLEKLERKYKSIQKEVAELRRLTTPQKYFKDMSD